MSVRRRGYVQTDVGRETHLRRGDTARVDVALERGGTISGRVVDEFGEPMADVRVEALLALPHNARLSSVSRQRETDDEGRFRLFELPRGRYFVRADRQMRAVFVVMGSCTHQLLRQASRISPRLKRS